MPECGVLLDLQNSDCSGSACAVVVATLLRAALVLSHSIYYYALNFLLAFFSFLIKFLYLNMENLTLYIILYVQYILKLKETTFFVVSIY